MSTFVWPYCEGPESHLSHMPTRERSHGLGVLCMGWLGLGHVLSWSWGGSPPPPPQCRMKGGLCEFPSKSQGLSLEEGGTGAGVSSR